MPARLQSANTYVALELLAPATADRSITEAMRDEYAEMPGLSLTDRQAARLCGVTCGPCRAALRMLVEQRVLTRTLRATFVRTDLLPRGH